jgi:hypothetical protein
VGVAISHEVESSAVAVQLTGQNVIDMLRTAGLAEMKARFLGYHIIVQHPDDLPRRTALRDLPEGTGSGRRQPATSYTK